MKFDGLTKVQGPLLSVEHARELLAPFKWSKGIDGDDRIDITEESQEISNDEEVEIEMGMLG